MPTVYRNAMNAYIDNCRAANAYSSSAYPREYTTSQYQRPDDMARRSANIYPYPSGSREYDDERYFRRSNRPRGDSGYSRRAPPPPPPAPVRSRGYEDPHPPPPTAARRRRPSTNTTATSNTSPSTGPPPRKSVRFTDNRRASGGSTTQAPQRPKTFARDAPPAAISESARETARRLFHRRPSDGGRPSAAPGRPGLGRVDSSRTVESTRAEIGTRVGSRRGGERERDGGRDYGRGRRR